MFWKKDRNIVVAMEVGSSKVAVAVAEIREDGSLVLLGVGESASHQIRKCEIVDFEMAQKCVHDALNDAESKTDVAIEEVYLAISGAHIRSINPRVTTVINSDGDEIMDEHVEDLRSLARQQPLDQGYVLIHDLLQGYTLDDGTVTENPVGLSSKRLLADYHLISGIATRLQTTIRCVKELSINVRNYALSSYATAQAVLTQEQKQYGAIVVNCGAGVTDYIVYQGGSVIHTGVIGVGGDHLTNDILSGLKLPYAKAETLKRVQGAVYREPEAEEEIIILPGSYNFEERRIFKSALVTIMQARQQEIFEILRDKLEEQPFWSDFHGSMHFTGGASQVEGLLPLATRIFSCPVEMARECPFDGDQHDAARPDLTTVLGLLQYARAVEGRPSSARGWERLSHSFKKMLSGAGLF